MHARASGRAHGVRRRRVGRGCLPQEHLRAPPCARHCIGSPSGGICASSKRMIALIHKRAHIQGEQPHETPYDARTIAHSRTHLPTQQPQTRAACANTPTHMRHTRKLHTEGRHTRTHAHTHAPTHAHTHTRAHTHTHRRAPNPTQTRTSALGAGMRCCIPPPPLVEASPANMGTRTASEKRITVSTPLPRTARGQPPLPL